MRIGLHRRAKKMSWKGENNQTEFIKQKLEELKRRKAQQDAPKQEIKKENEDLPRIKKSRFDELPVDLDRKPSLSGVAPVKKKALPIPTTIKSEIKTEKTDPPKPSVLSVPTKAELQNVFLNDGSFLEQFKRMQKLKIEVRKPDQLKQSDAQVKLEEESAGDVSAFSEISDDRKQEIERLAISVVVNGRNIEKEAENSTEFLKSRDGKEFDFYNSRLTALSAAKERAEQSGALPMVREEADREARRRKRKSRWGDWAEEKHRDPSLMAYAQQVYGSTTLSDDQWKQLEDQRKMRAIFEMMQAKKAQVNALQAAGRVKYEYDSDEEVDDDSGTWEHKRRAMEMEKTREVAEKLTHDATGKHHLGDFLPPEELDKFIERYDNLRNGQSVDFNQFEENKLKEDNVGFKMLQKMGWTEGQGLGASGSGITAPIANKGNEEQRGLGAGKANDLSAQDDEYDAYRKRMMLAYRFRPNPLNNPRRSYY